MARAFDGVDDQITFSAGTTALIARGAVTYLVYVRFKSNHRGGLLSGTETGTRKMGCNPFDNGHVFFAVNGSVGSNFDYSTFLNEYVIVGYGKASGNGATVTEHLWRSGSGWTHTDLGTIDASAGSTIDAWVTGLFDSGQLLHADIAVQALYASKLSNAAIDAAGLQTNLTAWNSLTPAALWSFNQASVGTAVTDLTGGGADQTALTGTAVADEPAGFTNSLNQVVTLGLQSTTDTPFAVTGAKYATLGLQATTDVPFAITAVKVASLGLITTLDTPLAMSIGPVPPDASHTSGPQRATHTAGPQRATNYSGPQRATSYRG